MRWLCSVSIFIAASMSAPAEAANGRWFFSTGIDYSTGDYGEPENTTIETLPLSAGYVAPRWSAMLIVPLVHIEGPGTVVPGGLGNGGVLGGLLGSSAAAPSPGQDVDETGVGDASLTVSATPVILEGGTELQVISRLRAPTGDTGRSLGTGEWAAALSGGFRHPFSARADVYGSIGYETALDGDGSGIIANLGIESYVAERVQIGALLNYVRATSTLQRDGAQAGGFVTYDLSQSTRLQAYAAAGLSDTSPDVSTGFRVIFAAE